MGTRLRITVEDIAKGTTEATEIDGDREGYVSITAAPCFVSQEQAFGNGTVTMTVKRPGPGMRQAYRRRA